MATENKMSFRDLIIEAQKGNNEAMTEIIEMYMQVVNKHSYMDGRIKHFDYFWQRIFLNSSYLFEVATYIWTNSKKGAIGYENYCTLSRNAWKASTVWC